MLRLPLCSDQGNDRAAARRRKIIVAARILFVENGFHATGMAQIAKQSGIAIGQIYRDFAAKEEIVAAIVEGDCATLMARDSLHRAIAAADSPGVWAWIRQFIQPADTPDSEQLFAEIVAESTRNERIAAIFARTHKDIGGNLRAGFLLLAPGDHLSHRRELLADLVLSQSLGLMQHRLLHPSLDIDALADMMIATIAREIEDLKALPE